MKFGYVAHPIIQNEDGSEQVDLAILNYSQLSKGAAVSTIRWHRSKTTDWSNPYFLGDMLLETATDYIQIMRAVDNAIEPEDNLNDPDSILMRWVRDGKAVQVAYDPRAKRYVAITQLEDENGKSWSHSFAVADEDNEVQEIVVTGKDEEEGKTRMGQELVKRATAQPELWGGMLGAWFADMRKVTAVINAKLPTIFPDTVYSKRKYGRIDALKAPKRVKKAKAESAAE